VHVEPWVDQADVLAHADLVVCHGGSGTVFGALAAGVPLVVVPVFADQFVNGERVAASGAGVVVEDEQSAAGIAAAIRAVLGTTSHRRDARRVGAEMASASTVDEVLDRFTTDHVGDPR
jgi:UDP:flavonoid glycosyltransferase YjiC (YdhE family)